MPSLSLSLLTAALALAGDASANLPRAVAGAGFLAVPIGTVEHEKTSRPRVRRDDGQVVEQMLTNKEFWYSAEIGFGNPPQNVTVLVDTGSSKLWINPDCEEARTDEQASDCQTYGRYDPADSETPALGPLSREVLRYGDPSDERTRTEAVLRYYADDLWFGAARLENQTFGVAARSSGISQPIFGLGPDLREGFDGTRPHSLVLHSMAEQGLIGSRIFALDLRHAEAATGAIIYGGVDRSRFIGTLSALPVIMGTGDLYRLAVTLDSIGVTTQAGVQSWSLGERRSNVLLDSGSTLSRLHYNVAYPILDALGAQETDGGYYVVPCSTMQAAGGVDFGFGGKTVTVPFTDFIIDLGDPDYCYVGVAVTSDQQIIGDTILRAGYFVFDWDSQEVHVGQAASCGEPDIVAVGGDAADVGEVTGKCKREDALYSPSTSSSETTPGTASTTRSPSTPTAKGTGEKKLPGSSYTTTFTVSTCLPFDPDCEVGALVTETIEPAALPTAGKTGGPSEDDDDGDGGDSESDDGGADGSKNNQQDGDDEDAGARPQVATSLVVLCGVLTGAVHLLL